MMVSNKFMARSILVSVLFLGSVGSAQAATAIFDFGANNGLNTSVNPDIYTRTVGGVTVTARGYNGIFSTTDFASQQNVTWSSGDGLGVSTYGKPEINLGDVSGTDPGEGLLLVFSQSVTLTNLAFGNWDSSDDADFAFGSPLASGVGLSNLTGVTGGGAWTAPGTYTGTHFFIAAIDDTSDDNDKFRLDGLTISYTTTAPVPEPATWAMMLAGFALLGASMRRRSRQARVRFAL